MQEMFSLHDTHSTKRSKDKYHAKIHMKHYTLYVPNVCSLSYLMQVTNCSVSQEHGMHGLWQFVEFPNFFIGKDRNVI